MEYGRLSARLELLHPESGLGQVRVGSRDIRGRLLRVLLPASKSCGRDSQVLEERFVRGNQVVATYGPTKTQGCRYQLAWHGIPCDVQHHWLGGVELVVSVQTEKWDSRPEIRVETRLTVDQWLTFDGAPLLDTLPTTGEAFFEHGDHRRQDVYLFRVAQGGPTCLVMIYPSDFCGAEMTADECGVAAVAFRLFARGLEKLEKGVILRSRLRCGFVDRHCDLSAARHAYRRFAESRPPLSA